MVSKFFLQFIFNCKGVPKQNITNKLNSGKDFITDTGSFKKQHHIVRFFPLFIVYKVTQ